MDLSHDAALVGIQRSSFWVKLELTAFGLLRHSVLFDQEVVRRVKESSFELNTLGTCYTLGT